MGNNGNHGGNHGTERETGGRPAGGALAGIRILDLTRMLSGPFCTALLADAGAEVIKIEARGTGDDARHFAPRQEGEGTYFMLLNRGKRSVTLDLKSPRGRDIVRDLARGADVLVENFRPGAADRLGIGYDAMSALNPGLVYASISGFGQDGPMAGVAAYDIIAQAMSGLMSITGFPDGPPTRVGESMGDIIAGLYGAFGILAALQARAHSGRGQHVDVAMFDSMFSLLVTPLSQYLFTGEEPRRVGNRHPVSTPFDAYRAGDGLVIIAVANERLFARFAACIGHPGLEADGRFSSDERRTRNEPALRALIEEWTGARSVAEVVETLGREGIPSSPIWTVPEAANSAQVAARGLITRLHHPTAGEIPLVPQPVRFSGTPAAVRRPPPLLGEHTDAILAGLLGLDDAAIAALRDDGVI